MATNTASPKIDGVSAVPLLQKALELLETANGELVLDFSNVHRIDPDALQAMEQLASKAHDKSVTIVLRGVNVDVYKVFKLVKLAPRFSFLN